MKDNQLLRLTEIFYSIQGEAAHGGMPCVFVRLSRCNLRCAWCDTTYSFKGGNKMHIDDIISHVQQFQCKIIEITGGEPLLQPPVHTLMSRLCDENYTVLIETSGSRDISNIDSRVHIIMDLKPPGSGEVSKNLYENIQFLKKTDEVKFVLLDENDYLWAKDIIKKYNLENISKVVLSPVHGKLNGHSLAEWILRDHLYVRLGLQIHKFLNVE